MKRFLLAILLFLCCHHSFGQTPMWAFGVGGAGADWSYVCKIATNGNVYVAGKFEGTVDLDPGPGVNNVTSAGGSDIFLACYTSAGTFLWGENMGGASNENTFNMVLDHNNNVILSGWMQGATGDFDPGPGVATLTGMCCGSGAASGNGFIAKYSASGAYQWAYILAGTLYPYSLSEGLEVDADNNVYIGGVFRTSLYVTPSITLYETIGTNYIIKYSPTGTVVWAHNFGGGADGQTRGIKINGANMYVAGFYVTTSDFYPWGSHSYLTAVGYCDMFIARYDTAGNFKWVRNITGSGPDELIDLEIDDSDNIYVTGVARTTSLTFYSTIGSTSITCPGGAANGDIVLAKYDSSGNYMWGKIMGGTGDEWGYSIDVNNGYLYNTGTFQNTVDFDPSGAVANMTSSGGYDAYVTKYDLNGNYICGFKIGSTGEDRGYYGLTHDPAGHVYISGSFSGTGTDFDPGVGTTLLTSAGNIDAYVAKYDWTGGGTIAGALIGDTACPGTGAYLNLVLTSGGSGPYSVTVSDGTTSTVYTGIVPGTPFLITPAPTTTTTYTVTAITGAGASVCLPPPFTISSGTVRFDTTSTTISASITGCNTYQLTNSSGGGGYTWQFGDGSTSTGGTVTHTYTSTTTSTYIASVTTTSALGCPIGDTILLTMNHPSVHAGNDTAVCVGASVSLSATISGIGYTYLWSTGSTSPTIAVTTSGYYWVRVTDGTGCSGTDTVHVSFFPPPIVDLGPDTTGCLGTGISLHSLHTYSSPTYLWNTGATTPSINAVSGGNYWLTVTQGGCSAADTVHITLTAPATLNLGADTTLCYTGVPLVLSSSQPAGTHLLWSTGSTTDTIHVATGGNYWLQVDNGCKVWDTIGVNMANAPYAIPSIQNNICVGDIVGLAISSHSNNAYDYSWNFGGSNIITHSSNHGGPYTVKWTTPGIYVISLQSTSVEGCIGDTVYDTVKVHGLPKATISVSAQTTVRCFGDSVLLDALDVDNANNYTWTPRHFFTGTMGPEVWGQVDLSGYVTLTVESPFGCKAADSVLFTPECCLLYFPTAFTPNGDGKNDVWRAIGDGTHRLHELRINNRWGQTVFETTNGSASWDGRFNGEKQDLGVYFYYVKYECNGQIKMQTGDITLIK